MTGADYDYYVWALGQKHMDRLRAQLGGRAAAAAIAAADERTPQPEPLSGGGERDEMSGETTEPEEAMSA